MTTQAARNPLTWILPRSLGISTFLIWLIYSETAATTEAEWVTVLPAANSLFNGTSAPALDTTRAGRAAIGATRAKVAILFVRGPLMNRSEAGVPLHK